MGGWSGVGWEEGCRGGHEKRKASSRAPAVPVSDGRVTPQSLPMQPLPPHSPESQQELPPPPSQVLIYNALGFPTPTFGHVSLILAPDKSKLSKRHGATSVGEFREQGFLADAMINYLSLLGWNDGTEQEIYTVQELSQKFSLERITKWAAVFDKTKLSWMNGEWQRARVRGWGWGWGVGKKAGGLGG